MVTIRLRRNGPYVIESDDVIVVDWEGKAYRIERRPIALCRLRRIDAEAVLRRHALENRVSSR